MDIGAHFGYFTLLASYLVGPKGKVLSIEAMPSTFEYLSRNIERNLTYNNVTVYQGAAYSVKQELVFRDFGLVASSLNSAFAARDSQGIVNGAGKVVKVQAIPADDVIEKFGLTNVDVVKIDAESSELHVLKGLNGTLTNIRPIVIMEVGDATPEGESTGALINFLANLDYSAYQWDQKAKLVPYTQQGHVTYANLTFVPKDRSYETKK